MALRLRLDSNSMGVSKARFEAFSDGVFAIVITLLVLELRVRPHLSGSDLHRELVQQVPRVGAYVLIFLSVGVFWVAHHLMVGSAACIDRVLLWVNLFFLMWVSLLPFAAGVLGGYPNSREAVALYGLNMVLVEVFLIWIWSRITHHLLGDGIGRNFVRTGFRRIQSGLLLYGGGARSALFAPTRVSLALFWLVPVSYVFLQAVSDGSSNAPHLK